MVKYEKSFSFYFCVDTRLELLSSCRLLKSQFGKIKECEGHSSLIFLILLFTKPNIEVSGWLYLTKHTSLTLFINLFQECRLHPSHSMEVCLPNSRLLFGLIGMWSSMKVTLPYNNETAIFYLHACFCEYYESLLWCHYFHKQNQEFHQNRLNNLSTNMILDQEWHQHLLS